MKVNFPQRTSPLTSEFTLYLNRYNQPQSNKKMNSTGRYIVRYEPSSSEHEYLQTRIEMSISDEATYDDMANFFDAFLKAAGFVYEGEVRVVK